MRERMDGHGRWAGRAFCPDSIRAFIGGLLAVLVAGCNQPAGSPEPAAPPPPVVSVAEVVVKEVAQWDEFTGHIEAVDTVEIRPRVAGYIERLGFKEGEEVRKGRVGIPNGPFDSIGLYRWASGWSITRNSG